MIRSLKTTLLCGALFGGAANAQPDPTPVEPVPAKPAATDSADEKSPVEEHRTTFDALTERALGRTSKRVRYDWRRGSIQVAALGGLPAELNNFESLRTGLLFRFPLSNSLLEFGVSYVFVSGTDSTEDLARTPYRQPGRPDRFELDFGFVYPLAEGIVTSVPAFFPAVELTLNAHAQVRYLLYPGAFSGLDVQESLRATFAGDLNSTELENLEDDRLPGMQIDPGKYVALVGFGQDLYFQSGFFLSSRVLVATPLLVFMSNTEMLFGFEWDLLFGVAF